MIDETEGMANTRPRAVVISTNTGKDISVAHYRKHALRRLSSVLYKYPLNGTAELLNISIGEKNPSPGTVLQAQVPEQKRKIKLDKEKPVIEDLTDRSSHLSGSKRPLFSLDFGPVCQPAAQYFQQGGHACGQSNPQ